MRRLVSFTILLCLICSSIAFATLSGSKQFNTDSRLAPEELQYKVMFKWGLINKRAGSATLSLKHGAEYYEAKLTARSEPWADRVFEVRDTLIGRISYDNLRPLYYEKIAHEGNDDKHDIVQYDYSAYPPLTRANCIRKVVKKGEVVRDETRSLESDIKTVDMLTSFFYMRSMPFDSWEPGHCDTTAIFSGKEKETLSIVYEGREQLEIDDVYYPCYHITFKFTRKGGKKSSDDMDAWIWANNSRIPLRLEGKLPIGKVHCIYLGL